MKPFFILSAVICLLGACAPVSRGLSNASDSASGISRVGYAAEPWDVVNALVDIVPSYTPLGTHGSLQILYFEDDALGLAAEPVKGVTAYNRDVIPFTVEVIALQKEGYSEVKFTLDPPNYEPAWRVKDDLLRQLDIKLRRRSLS